MRTLFPIFPIFLGLYFSAMVFKFWKQVFTTPSQSLEDKICNIVLLLLLLLWVQHGNLIFLLLSSLSSFYFDSTTNMGCETLNL